MFSLLGLVLARRFSGSWPAAFGMRVAGLVFYGGGTYLKPTERWGVAWRVQNGLGAGAAGAGVGGSHRDRAVFSGEDNAALCGGSEQQNGRRKGPLGKESADELAKILLRHNACCLSPF